MQEINVDVAIIGSGTAGLNALGQVKKAGKKFVLINGGEAGTTCARVGCMPSKAFIQIAEDFHRKHIFNRHGLENHEELRLNLETAMEHVRMMRDTFVDRVTSNSTDNMSDEVFIQQHASFLEPNLLQLEDGRQVRAGKIVLATGSTPVVPKAWQAFGDRILTTDQFFEQEQLPERLAVIGLGVIGLELGQAAARMGVQVVGIDQAERIAGISDPVISQAAIDIISKDMPLWLGQAAQISEQADGSLLVTAGDNSFVADKVLVAMGRSPNVRGIGLDKLGVALDARGVPEHNPNSMQVGDLPIFLAGDVSGFRQILHEAGDEGKIAGYNAAHEEVTAFRRKTPLAIVFTDPNILAVGQRYAQLNLEQTAIAEMKLAPVGRAMIMGRNQGVMRLYADKASGKLLGAEMVAVHAEHLGHLLTWSIEMGMTIGRMLQMPFYHPVLEEALQPVLNQLYQQVEAKNPSPVTELETI